MSGFHVGCRVRVLRGRHFADFREGARAMHSESASDLGAFVVEVTKASSWKSMGNAGTAAELHFRFVSGFKA